MSKPIVISLLIVVAGLGVAAPLVAQDRSAVSGAELDAVVAARSTDNREVVQRFLTSDQARAAAEGMGVSAADLSERVATLDPVSLQRIRSELVDRGLVGGADTIIISSTVVIIALLLIILLTR